MNRTCKRQQRYDPASRVTDQPPRPLESNTTPWPNTPPAHDLQAAGSCSASASQMRSPTSTIRNTRSSIHVLLLNNCTVW